jgi:hypothetical protein
MKGREWFAPLGFQQERDGQSGNQHVPASGVLSKLPHYPAVGWLECCGFQVVPFPQCQPQHLKPIFW